MKKLLSIIVAAFMVFFFTGLQPLSAKPASNTHKVITVNEYDYVKEIQNMSTSELKAKGLTDEEIGNLPTVAEYKDKMKERSKLSKETLKDMGYSDNQVQAFTNFTGAESEVTALSATVTIDCAITTFSYSASTDRTTLSTRLDWSWSSMPIIEFNDIVAIGWSSGFVQTSSLNSYNYLVPYYTGGQVPRFSWKIEPGQGASSIFPVAYGGGSPTNWAKTGYAVTEAVGQGYIGVVGVNFAYGHQTITVSPSIDWNGTGGFQFGFDTDEVTDYIYLDW
ncbi:hypothetical protein [Desulfitobacterium sp.]|uniref:hypothetical protein n=1 Tax=Desulfitobacterium sp. TaxID=49981 RepID=UPI002B2215E8|nr:hypothetical protein [Desulfitobacterium sp.]MEA4902921.1 hypothetical protein [Desulfitobacterium sp.]